MSDRFPDPNIAFHRQQTRDNILMQKITGSLVYLTTLKKYEKSKMFKCESRACRYQKRVKHAGNAPCCLLPLPGHTMIEQPRATEVAEYWDARFLYDSKQLPLTIRIPSRITSLHWKLGARYNIIFHWDLHLSMYSAWYIIEAKPDFKPYYLSQVPNSILILRAELENQCAQSAWTLVSYVSAELCTSVVPRGVLHNLKMGLLLSLASMRHNRDTTVKPIPLFCLSTMLISKTTTIVLIQSKTEYLSCYRDTTVTPQSNPFPCSVLVLRVQPSLVR
uniref:Uncharacterized protein n=1 Tax=Cacopsylla melanoneura TaxID=428564 RepID=A0A8D8X8V1_9HEMI